MLAHDLYFNIVRPFFKYSRRRYCVSRRVFCGNSSMASR
jgi:hypothetical protein